MRRDNSFFQKDSADALKYVYEKFLKKPYSDLSAHRGFYIAPPGKYLAYPANRTPDPEPHAVYRPNHGLAHNVRVTSKIRDVAAFYHNKNKIAEVRFANFLQPEEITKLEIVGAFYVARRESEAVFSEEP